MANLGKLVEDGAEKDPDDIAKPTSIELFSFCPDGGFGATQQMTVLAQYSDGTTRDITPLTVFQSSNDVSAAIDEHGKVLRFKGRSICDGQIQCFYRGCSGCCDS